MPSYEKVKSHNNEDDEEEDEDKWEVVETRNKDDDSEEETKGSHLMCCIIVICVILMIGVIDSFTTTYAKRGSLAFARWSIDNAPWSFLLYLAIIIILICCCLPYGPLSVLMGAVFSERYGFEHGVGLGIVCLFIATMTAAVICFLLARHNFKDFVQRKMTSNPRLSFLRNLDRLIVDGQGFEMVLLIRLAPLPTGPTQYFLGTTSVTWRDFLGGNACTNMLFAISDILIGAGASSLKRDNVVGMVCFVIGIIGFFALIFYVGLRAKHKLEHLDERERKRITSIEFGVEEEEGIDGEDDFDDKELSDTGIYSKNTGRMKRWESVDTVSTSQMNLAVSDAPVSDEDLIDSNKINGRRI